MTFTEEWFSPVCQERLAELGKEVADVPGLIIEIGSWEGRSTCALANAINPRVVHAVDTWQGSPAEISATLAAQRDVFATWQTNVKVLTAGNVEAHRMGWREYVPTITEPVALCFIDAEHTYREVFDNITAILPHLSSGGVLCGDDVSHPPVRRAVQDTLPADDVWVRGNVWSWRKP
jgi:predicted O-methyltransferase YrrM